MAEHWLASKSIDWQTGLKIFNSLIEVGEQNISLEVIRRIIEIKPSLLRKLQGTKQLPNYQLLQEIAESHQSIVLDHSVALHREFDVPIIKTVQDLQLALYGPLSQCKDLPESGFITGKSRVLGFGSCFAVNFVNYILQRGIAAKSSVVSEDINSPINNLNLLKWALLNETNYVSEQLNKLTPEFSVGAFRDNLLNATHVIFTLGTIYSIATLSGNSHVPSLLLTKNSITYQAQYDEVKDTLRSILTLLRQTLPNATIFVSVSPIPLKGVLSTENPILANHVSKSILLSAIHSLKDGKLFNYIPIYDTVMSLAPYCAFPLFRTDDNNPRHFSGLVTDTILSTISDFLIKK